MSSYYDQDDDAYVFEFNGNLVTAVYEYEHGRLEYERIKSYETWSFDGTTVTKTEVEHGVTETSTYTDLDGDGLYTQASHSYGSSSASESDTTSELSDDSYIGESKVFSADDSHNDTDDSAGDDYLGSSDDDMLSGSTGDDTLDAGDGDDDVYGGDGDDVIIGGDGGGDDVYDGGVGHDTLEYTSATAGLSVNLKAGIARAMAGNDDAGIGTDSLVNIENVVGGHHADRIVGSGKANTLTGNNGDDRLYGQNGNDKLYGGSGSDKIFGGNHNDKLYGGKGDDTLTGGSGKDKLFAGLDQSTDTFVFKSIDDTSTTAKGRDQIFQFDSGEDLIDLASIDADTDVSGNQSFDEFLGEQDRAFGAENSLWYVDTGKHLVVRGDVTGDGQFDFEIQVNNLNSLVENDFML